MKIGILTQFYAPEPGPAQLPTTLAEALAARGHTVRVVTGLPNYPTGELADGYGMARSLDEVRNGVAIRRVYLHPDHGSGLGRVANYGTFGVSSIINGLPTLRGADAVWVNASPVTLAWPIWALRSMRIPVASHILDLWPESLFASGFDRLSNNMISAAVLHAWTNSVYRGSDQVAYISPGVRELLMERGVPPERLHYIPMWADEKTFNPGGVSMRAELNIPAEATVLVYAGALGAAQGLETLIDACALVNDPQFMCVIAGSGSAELGLRDRARGLGSVRFIGRLPQPQMTGLLASADASFVSLRDTPLGRVSTPSKTQAALASGTPILMAAEGDARDVITRSGGGWTAAPHDARDIARAIQQLIATPRTERLRMGQLAVTTYEKEFSLDRAVHQVEALLEAAARRDHTTGASS